MAKIRFSVFAFLVIAAACSKEKSDPVSEEIIATQMIGASGGTLSSAGVVVEVPAGAVATMTAFEIRRVSGLAGPDDTAVIGEVYRLTPDDVTFATPVKVSLPVAGGPAADDLVLVRRGSEDADWVPIGGGDAGATSVSGATSHFSWMALVRMAFAAASCTVPTDCALACSPAGTFPPSSCTGSCSVRGTMTSAGVDCALAPEELQNASHSRIACTCVAGSTSATPRHTSPYVFDAIDGALNPSAVIYTAATWCGWPCSAGVDAGAQTRPDSGPAIDAGGQTRPDSGPAIDAGPGRDTGASAECVNDLLAAPDDSYNVEYESPVSTGALTGGVLQLDVPWILSSTSVQGRAASEGRVRARMEFSMEAGGLYVKRYGETDDPPMSEYLRARVTLTDRDGASSKTGPVINVTLDCPADERDFMQTWEYQVIPTGGGRAIQVIRPEGSSVLVSEIYSGR